MFALNFPVKNIAVEEAVPNLVALIDSLELPQPIRESISIIQDRGEINVGFSLPKKLRKEDLESFKPVLE